jgi:hypothetical protein
VSILVALVTCWSTVLRIQYVRNNDVNNDCVGTGINSCMDVQLLIRLSFASEPAADLQATVNCGLDLMYRIVMDAVVV